MTTSRERPLLATDRVALALRNGWQTQDRRPVNDKNGKPRKAAYEPGDMVYVRECFGYVWPEYCEFDGMVSTPEGGWRDVEDNECDIVFRASKPYFLWWSDDAEDHQCTKWRPNIFMPKRIARTWLRVLSVDQEWLPHISKADAIAEGCGGLPFVTKIGKFKGKWILTPQDEFKKMWADIYLTAEMFVWRYELELVSTTGKPETEAVPMKEYKRAIAADQKARWREAREREER